MKVIGLRDNICSKSVKTTCGSKMLENYISPYNATIVEKLNQANIEIKKVEIKEFGIEDDDYVEEAFNDDRVEAVITTDFDGKIARNCTKDLVGIKPTFGLVSRYGVVTIAPSLEQIGIVGKDIETITEVLNIIKGYDNKDSGSVNEKDVKKQSKVAELNIGYINEEDVENLRGKKDKVGIRNLRYISATHYIISSAEASSNLARFDGIKYGYRAEGAKTWKEVYTKTRQEGFGYEVKKKMIAGTFFLDVNNIKEYYNKAQQIRTVIKREVEEIFKTVDVIVFPNEREYACLANLTGRPAVTINNVIFLGKHFDEDNLLELAKTYGGDK